jgi:hypothetical protein
METETRIEDHGRRNEDAAKEDASAEDQKL